MRSWRDVVQAYLDRRILIILLLGFSSGLPLLLVYTTLSAWLTEEGVSRTAIGLFSWASTAYTIKWLWSPLVDRLPIPRLSRWLGQRRAWMLVSQAGCMITMWGLGGSDPSVSLATTAAWAVALAFFSATQDIVIDAYRVESLDRFQYGAGAAVVVLGYRIGMLAAGGGALILADHMGWTGAYQVMALLMLVGVATALVAPDTGGGASKPAVGTPEAASARAWLRDAVFAPLADFARRPHWITILLFVGLYKYGDALLGLMANPFYLSLGFTKTQIGAVSKLYGLVMTIAGGFLGGVLVVRLGMMRALLVCGVLQAASNLAFMALAAIGASVPALVVTISVENLSGGMGTAAFVAYLSSLCSVAYTATQYALVSSFAAFTRTLLASGGGWLADQIDWVWYFGLTTLAAIPGLALLTWMIRTFPPGDDVQVDVLADDG
jgi:MFS transporter, PAT family, beta-lactamase induction signal transducer AmpG